ncbi:hypothetical protein NW765_017599 [Fusarium oxysporum]|nr:hypothetical protein NW765_017599 [Fusarium oxysporum]
MSPSQKVKVLRLVSVHYQHLDLDKAAQFLNDFGLIEVQREEKRIYFGGYGRDPYLYIAEQAPSSHRAFLGATWAVDAANDLVKAATLPGASKIVDAEGPGGGKKVTIPDPNGFTVTFIHGQALKDIQDDKATRILNNEKQLANQAVEKPRRGQFLRFGSGPSPVHKLGHYGYFVPKDNFQKTFEWYTNLINIVPSDAVFNPETGDDSTYFMHIDLELFLGTNPNIQKAFVHHSSFEVNDMDTQALGHKWLQEKGYTNCWGIGRHVLGSQIFDYWFDTSGNILEHYSDGDLVNKDTPFTRTPEAPDSLHIWGPNVPLGFIIGKPEN